VALWLGAQEEDNENNEMYDENQEGKLAWRGGRSEEATYEAGDAEDAALAMAARTEAALQSGEPLVRLLSHCLDIPTSAIHFHACWSSLSQLLCSWLWVDCSMGHTECHSKRPCNQHFWVSGVCLKSMRDYKASILSAKMLA
jgi:hypothetical protein